MEIEHIYFEKIHLYIPQFKEEISSIKEMSKEDIINWYIDRLKSAEIIDLFPKIADKVFTCNRDMGGITMNDSVILNVN